MASECLLDDRLQGQLALCMTRYLDICSGCGPVGLVLTRGKSSRAGRRGHISQTEGSQQAGGGHVVMSDYIHDYFTAHEAKRMYRAITFFS